MPDYYATESKISNDLETIRALLNAAQMAFGDSDEDSLVAKLAAIGRIATNLSNVIWTSERATARPMLPTINGIRFDSTERNTQ